MAEAFLDNVAYLIHLSSQTWAAALECSGMQKVKKSSMGLACFTMIDHQNRMSTNAEGGENSEKARRERMQSAEARETRQKLLAIQLDDITCGNPNILCGCQQNLRHAIMYHAPRIEEAALCYFAGQQTASQDGNLTKGYSYPLWT
jgi:hypothetical protein